MLTAKQVPALRSTPLKGLHAAPRYSSA